MAKLFRRYSSDDPFGVVASHCANVLFSPRDPWVVLVPQLDAVARVHLRQGAAAGSGAGAAARPAAGGPPVTRTALSPDGRLLAAGHADGAVRLWALAGGGATLLAELCGHRGQVLALAFDAAAARLASGAADGAVVVWDVAAESGLFRLRGHKDAILDLRFIHSPSLDPRASLDPSVPLDPSGSLDPSDPLDPSGSLNPCVPLDPCVPTEPEAVPSATSAIRETHLVSSSRDGLAKVWDLHTKHAVESLVAHRGPVAALAAHPARPSLLLSAADDGLLRVWHINHRLLSAKLDPSFSASSSSPPSITPALTLQGSIQRSSSERVVAIKFDASASYIVVQSADRLIDIFRFRSSSDIRRRIDRRKKKLAKAPSSAAVAASSVAPSDTPSIEDRFFKVASIRCSAKVVSFDIVGLIPSPDPRQPSLHHPGGLRIVCSLSNNAIEAHELVDPASSASSKSSSANPSTRLISTVDIAGHRSDIRSVALSSDDDLILTGSNDLVKIWSARTHHCLKTIPSGYVLCSAFLPGNKHVVVGTKSGHLQLFDLASSSLIESIQAHSGPVWSLQVRADKNGIITGSQDKEVKFWDLRLCAASISDSVEAPSGSAMMPTLVHTRTLKMSDDVLCVRQSPDGRLLAVSLLDSTVKVFYCDTFKFFLSLYGHKLPVLSMDISFDSTLIITASSDKSVKIWGLDFGDCHRSLLAHDDSVMSCQFVWGTHYFFTSSKDKTVKYWDADTFQQIQRLTGHQGEVWSLAVAKYGRFVVSVSHDRSIRLWQRTEDVFTLEEEREREIDETHERDLAATAADADRHDLAVGSGVPDVIDGIAPASGDIHTGTREVTAAGIQTIDTLKAGERIAEALDVWHKERTDIDTYHRLLLNDANTAPPPRHPLVIATGKPDLVPEEYVLHVVRMVRASQLDEALLVLPFAHVISLLKCVAVWIEKQWSMRLSTRILFFLVQTHHKELVTTRALRPVLTRLRTASRASLCAERDVIGYNVAAVGFLCREYRDRHATFFGDDEDVRDDGDDVNVESQGKGQGQGKKRGRQGGNGSAVRVVTK